MDKPKRPGFLPLLGCGIFIMLWIGKTDFSHLRTVDYVAFSGIAVFFVVGAVMAVKNRKRENDTSGKPGIE